MRSITYYGQQITVSDEVAEFLERDRLHNAAMHRQEQRHVNYVGFDIATVPDLFTDEPSDPTFKQAFRNLRKQDLRNAYQTLSDDDRKLLCLYYYHELSMEQIGRRYGVTKMAISKRLRKIHDHLRSLIVK
ncbi:MAG: sigma-70 family RNA polymerase sigma factor [Oscillospiraceae bacterium]|nr:sigma-70 family RNA polymerase sigma factor [Oscillospiraceae bacterium]